MRFKLFSWPETQSCLLFPTASLPSPSLASSSWIWNKKAERIALLNVSGEHAHQETQLFYRSTPVHKEAWRCHECFPKAIGFPDGSDGKESAYNAGDLGLIAGLGRSPGEGNGSPLQYSCLEKSTDRGAWRATVHEVTKSRTRLNN